MADLVAPGGGVNDERQHVQNTYEGIKRYGGNQIFANLNGTKLKAKLIEDGFTTLANNYGVAMQCIGNMEGFVRVSGNVWEGGTTGTPTNVKYYMVVRLADTIASWNDLEDEPLADGTTYRCKYLNLQEYESSLFDLRNVYLSQNQGFSLRPANFSVDNGTVNGCLLYTSPSPRDVEESRMPSSA